MKRPNPLREENVMSIELAGTAELRAVADLLGADLIEVSP
jgi:hypothetical protein